MERPANPDRSNPANPGWHVRWLDEHTEDEPGWYAIEWDGDECIDAHGPFDTEEEALEVAKDCA